MPKQTVFFLIRGKDGKLVQRPIRFDSTNRKLEQKYEYDMRRRLFLSKKLREEDIQRGHTKSLDK